MPARKGLRIHEEIISASDLISVGEEVKIFQPTIEPIIACETETTSPLFIRRKTVSAAAKETVKEPAIAFTSPSEPSVWVAPYPLIRAPSITNREEIITAVVYFRSFVLVAVPKILPASLAPRFHPRKRPLRR